MKKLSFIAVIIAFFSFTQADDITNNFQSNLNQPALDALAKDLGSLMGGGSFHHGESLGFPLGFDIGVHAPIVRLKDEDVILRDDGSKVDSLWGQVEVGLPARINLIGRVGKLLDGDTYGGGLRLGILKSAVPGVPSISVSGLYSVMEHDFIDLNTISINAALSFDLPFIRPYIGAGYDRTKLEPTSTAYAGVPASVSRSLEGEADGSRVEAGINLSIFPFTYLTFGAGLANGETLYHLGAGFKI